jgi:hypothetical protein
VEADAWCEAEARVSSMADRYAKDAAMVTTLASGILTSVITGNPLPAIAAFIPVVDRLNDVRQQEYKQSIIARRAADIARSPQAGSDKENWLQAERELLIAQRAREIASSPAAAGELDNWLRAEREVLTRLRAAEIARSPQAGSDQENWLQAEREVLIAQRAREIAASPQGRGELDNWLMAEKDLEARGIIKPRSGRGGFGASHPLTVRAILRYRREGNRR